MISEPLHIVRADVEGLIWIVLIVIAIINHLVKAGRKAASRSANRPTAAQTSPEGELKAFLESLGAETAPAAPRSAPKPRPTPPPPRNRKATVRPPATPAPPPPTPAPAIPHPPQPVEIAAYATKGKRINRSNAYKLFVRDTRSLREAIVLKEILGPPVGLRRPGQSG